MDALLFVPVAIAISLTPGPNNFCGLNNGIRAGVGPAMIATVGRAAAFAIFLTVSAVGLGAMLLASEAAFTAVKWVGAAYLFWLGWKAWHSCEFSGLALDDAPGGAPASGQPAQFSLRALITQEFLLGITNRLCCTSRKADEITPAPDAAMPWHPRAPCSGARVA